MVVGTVVACATIINGEKPAVVAGGIGTTAGLGSVHQATIPALGGAIGASASAGAIVGSGITKSADGGILGAIAGGTSALGVGASGIGLMTGGMGLLAVGTSVTSVNKEITYDCWKPVVHDMSEEPSSGMLLKDLVCHRNVATITMTTGLCTELPNIVIENIWNETFEIQYMFLHDTEKIACHAKPVYQ